VGASSGLGLIARGFGLGFATVLDAGLQGDNLLNSEGTATLTVGFMTGYAHQFGIGGMNLKVGGVIRPMLRLRTGMTGADLAGFLMAGGEGEGEPAEGEEGRSFLSLFPDAYYGTGIGLDVGAILEMGGLSVGLAIQDLFGTRFNYQRSSLAYVWETFNATQSLPQDGEVVETPEYVIPMEVTAGVSFHPDLGPLSFLIDPTVHADLQNVVAVMEKRADPADLIHVGAEVKVFRFISLRAGFSRGYMTAGLGAKLLFLDVNVAAFAEGSPEDLSGLEDPEGFDFRTFGNMGITAEIAIRI
jgi:hypothetical protein